MSYKINFAAADVSFQIELLKLYPEIANKNFYPAMNRSVRVLISAVRSKMSFNDVSGKTRSTINSRVSGRGLNITARVGWFGVGAVKTANLLEHGTSAHKIGNWMHPGYAPYKFMAEGFAASENLVESEMETAMVNTVNDLAVK